MKRAKREKMLPIRLTKNEYEWLQICAKNYFSNHESQNENISTYIRHCILENDSRPELISKEINELNLQIRKLRLQYEKTIERYQLGYSEQVDLRFISQTLFAIEELLREFNQRMEIRYGNYKNE